MIEIDDEPVSHYTLWWTNIAIENGPVEIVDCPIKNGGSFHSNMLVHQRVSYYIPWISHEYPMNIPWISHEYPMNIPWNPIKPPFSYGFPMLFVCLPWITEPPGTARHGIQEARGAGCLGHGGPELRAGTELPVAPGTGGDTEASQVGGGWLDDGITITQPSGKVAIYSGFSH